MDAGVMDTLDPYFGSAFVVVLVLAGLRIYQRRMTGQSWPGLQHAWPVAALTFVVWMSLSSWLR